MSQVVLIQRTFAARQQADRWFDALRPTAWPYVWCTEDPVSRRWRVRALIEKRALPAIAPDADAAGL